MSTAQTNTMNILINKLKLGETQKEELRKCEDYTEFEIKLKSIESGLDHEIANLEKESDSQKLLDELHRYNNIKDMAQSLIGSLANIQGVTLAKLHKDFNLDDIKT